MAARKLDTGPTVAELRAERARHQAADERKQRKRKSRRPAAAAPVAGAPQQRPRKRSWGARANAICRSAQDESLLLIERYPVGSPQEAIQLLEATVRLTAQVIGRLERLGPAPNRRLHGQLMRELSASLAELRRLVASLKVRWNVAAVRRVSGDSARDRRIVRLFRKLGAPGCAEL